MSEAKQGELGDFLRSRRERLTPKAVGLPNGRRRRTAGLRREEVAQLAGIGVDWYIRLEQGRSVSPSAITVDALARALRLDKVEHGHLRALTRGARRRAFSPETVPESLHRLLRSVNNPAYVTGRRWDLLGWNTAAADILGFDRLAGDERNVLISMLTLPASRRLFGDGWADEARRMIAQFRSTHDLWASDSAFADLLDRLRDGCPEFSGWWGAHDVRAPGSGAKRLHHPTKGVLDFEYATFQANEDSALKLAIYTPI